MTVMVREEEPLQHFRSLLQDLENGRYDFYEDNPKRKDEAEKIYKQVIRILEAEEENNG